MSAPYYCIHNVDDEPVARIYEVVDSPFSHTDVMEAIRRGYIVTYVREEPEPPLSATTSKPVAPAAPVAPVEPSRGKRGRPAKMPPAPSGTFARGEHVFLRWSTLREDMRVHLSQFRTIAGVVEDKKSSTYSCGVRFDDNPDLVWLSLKELSSTLEIEG